MINNKVLAIILGGGQGSRLHPLTEQDQNQQFQLQENIDL